jgi:hypothetical protein
MAVMVRIPSGVYPEILGDSWHDLDEAIRCVHDTGSATVRATGVFRILQGSNRLVRWLARFAGLPAAGEAVAVHLVICAKECGEEWRRTFDGRPLLTTQFRDGDALVERLGIVALRFRLTVRAGALYYETTRTALCLGWLRLPLPRWLGPRVTACERADGDQIQVRVDVDAPLLGRLLVYEGRLTRSEEPA